MIGRTSMCIHFPQLFIESTKNCRSTVYHFPSGTFFLYCRFVPYRFVCGKTVAAALLQQLTYRFPRVLNEQQFSESVSSQSLQQLKPDSSYLYDFMFFSSVYF